MSVSEVRNAPPKGGYLDEYEDNPLSLHTISSRNRDNRKGELEGKACLEVKVKELFLRLYLHEVQLLLIEEREYVVVGRKGADQVKPSALKRKDGHWANCLL